jgi:tetratricopeptide (TPR) repeat protein
MALALAPLAPAVAQTPEELFQRGNDAYQEGRFLEAAGAYRGVLRFGIEDPRVEYNLGNAEFRLGNLGSAILHYERARRLSPTDLDILANLEFARSQTLDQVEPTPIPPPVRWLRTGQDRLGPDAQAWICLSLVWAIGTLVAWGMARPGRWGPRYGWILASLALALALSLGSWYGTQSRLEGTPLAVVLAPVVEVLAGPGENNATLFTVHEGLTVEVRGDSGEEWLQVSLPNGLSGWLPIDAVGRV